MKRVFEAEDSCAHICLDQTCLVRDLLVPILVDSGNVRDLVSFFCINSRLLRLYRDLEEHCLSLMLAYRIVPLRMADRVIPRRMEQIGHQLASFTHAAVVALCDTAFSIKKDTTLYVRVSNEWSPMKHRLDFREQFQYWYQKCDGGVFEYGIRSNTEVKELLENASPVDYFILQH